MPDKLAVGEEAPNFDLASTEDVVLMLRDEVPRTAVVLYFFNDPGADAVRGDLRVLGGAVDGLARRRAKVLAVSPAKLETLKELQGELGLRFPLLHDDRGFARHYGLGGEDGGADRVLVAVGRRQEVLLVAPPGASAESALPEIDQALKRLASPTDNYPRSVVNRLVNWWVN